MEFFGLSDQYTNLFFANTPPALHSVGQGPGPGPIKIENLAA
jgi:hypothetical protein